MIKQHHNGSMLMKFGTGDIGITIGGDYGRGALLFSGQEPQRAPAPGDFGPVGYASTRDYPLSMIFTSAESIDHMIRSLFAAKKIMEGQVVLVPDEGDWAYKSS
ncbi:MAG: hypothetical protein LBS19_10815 [Clostridiales bacterium]|jgi:hypothetical protein|nr:hypothetical protein [Clostridiales bacterium]